jgi:hypothetical protein
MRRLTMAQPSEHDHTPGLHRPPMAVTLPAELVTVVLTSCGREDLLARTLGSFLAHHRPGRIVIVEDSADPALAARVVAHHPGVDMLPNAARLGQLPSIDRAYATVTTPLVLHLEDDWEFTGPIDIPGAVDLLERRAEVNAVCFRRLADLQFKERIRRRRFSHGSGRYARLDHIHPDWHGHTFNPTLLRLATWQAIGPFAGLGNERAISRAVKDRGGFVAYQLPGVCGHIGDGRRVADPVRVRHARSRTLGNLWRRLARRPPA